MGDKAYQKGIKVNLGLIGFQADLFTVKRTNAGKSEETKLCCPTCTGSVSKVNQFYQCETDPTHTGLKQGDCDKFKEGPNGLVRVSKDAVKVARTSDLAPKVLDINVHRIGDVQVQTIENGNTYVLRVGDHCPQLGVIRDLLLRRPDLVLMGQMNLNSQDKLFRLVPGLNDQLLIEELVWPSDMDSYPEPDASYKPEMLTVAEKFAEGLITDFDPDQYKRSAREKMEALVSTDASGTPVAPKQKVSTEDDLMAALQAAIAS